MLDMQRKLTKPFYMMLSLPSTAMGFALSIQIAALSWLLSTQHNLDIHQIGIVWAAGPVAGILGQVIIGFISDKVWFWNGRRRPFILIGGFFAAMSLLALPNIGVISDSLGLEGVMGIAILVALSLDLSVNISFNPTRSIIADVTEEGKPRTLGYTWMQTVSGTFGMLAYLIGAQVGNITLIYVGVFIVLAFSLIPPFFIEEPRELELKDETDEPESRKFDFMQLMKDIKPLWGFLGYSIYASYLHLSGVTVESNIGELIAFVITLFFVFETLATREEGKPKEEADHIGFKKILAAHSFSWIGVQTMFVFTYAFLQEKMPLMELIPESIANSGNAEAIKTETDMVLGQIISYSFAVLNFVGALLPAFVLGPLANKIGRIKTHSYALIIMAVAYGIIGFMGTTPTMMYLLMAVAGIGWASIISLPFAIMSERVEQGKMGLYMGLFNLSVVLPQLVVSLGISLFLNRVEDKSMIFMVCAVSLAISAIAWLVIKENPHGQPDPAGLSVGDNH
ncbi:MFS transporter [Saccharobesus litoralis]|uniref:MFS transporter n=1 Tax=Saccharobesus litoralis TaxID=2172099 RepID=A0A2S0VU59_9ALTE|nr:MFS transporter [Saccharobesus litoralis]AWB67756.1 MFS transporter [Saccharobesus litoralis]